MQNMLESYIPESALQQVNQLLVYDNLTVLIKNERKTRHGDYRRLPNNKHQITINNNLNLYRFLITLIHEIAHFETYKKYGRHIKPHGLEWKHTFQHLMLPFIHPDIFPNHLLPLLARHFKNPKASSDTDIALSAALKKYDPPNNKILVSTIPLDTIFTFSNGKTFKRGKLRRTRIECQEVSTKKVYLFHPNAEVEVV